MKRFIESVLHFRREERASFCERYGHLAQRQAPSTMLLGCADSRLVSQLVAGYEPGELFVVRNAGNFAPPHGDADTSVAAAVSFAVETLGVRDIVVCGHSSCGAMQALLAGREQLNDPSLKEWLRHGEPALDRLRNAATQDDDDEPSADALSRENVVLQMEHLRAHPSVQKQGVRVHGCYFDLKTGEIYIHDAGAATFVVLDEDQAQRILKA